MNKNKQLDWEKEFDKVLNDYNCVIEASEEVYQDGRKVVKQFIKQLLTQQRTELLEEIKKIINEELLVCPYCFNRIKDYECTACDHYDGYSVEKRIEQINENINLLNKKDD